MASQRFCLRWNNHQTNLLSVFDQLLHAETFTDVTLAVEGQYLKAHKMVLSACSPYFQALFINHPEKHPIVILKDITFADMKSLLDFMYRGEVSVDQDRLTAFLRVAESLRIKGLTEVNDEKPEKSETPAPQNQTAQTPNQPPQLHRIQQPYTQQQKVQGMMLTNPLLGSALTQPKRKRGRPRKLSGSSNGNDFDDYESSDNIIQGSPELLEVKMGTDGYSDGSDDNNRDIDNDNSVEEPMDTTESMKSDTPQPSAKEPSPQKEQIDNNIGDDLMDQTTSKQSNQQKQYVLVASNNQSQTEGEQRPTMKIRINPLTQRPSTSNLANALQQLQSDSINNNQMTNDLASNLANTIQANFMSTQMVVAAAVEQQQQQLQKKVVENSSKNDTTQTESVQSSATSRQPQRRRCRRKGSNQDDQAEHLTEMSVRGLNLFRYAKIFEGIYQCTECAKENVQKTFKNKYSFQRHAFLYHEGTSRKVFPCPVCSKEFSRPDKMKNHMKMTHDCYMPKDSVVPLSYSDSQGAQQKQSKPQTQSQTSATTQQREQELKRNDSNDTQSGKQASSLRIENVMSQYTAQIADAAQHIKIEVSD